MAKCSLIHSPDQCAMVVVEPTSNLPIDMGCLSQRELIFLEGLAHDVQPGRQWRISVALRTGSTAAALKHGRDDFSLG